MDKKSISNRRLNNSYINKKENNILSFKKRDAKIKQNNNYNKLSLKQKIHLYHQRREALIKQYSNKNKIIIEKPFNNEMK